MMNSDDHSDSNENAAGSNRGPSFTDSLESRLHDRSEQLEEIHLEAAIDAQLTVVGGADSKSKPVIIQADVQQPERVIFEDYTNPNSVPNCLSPYVPSSADRIQAFVAWAGLNPDDVLLDIGCGDGRVCIAASKLSGKGRTVAYCDEQGNRMV